MTFYCPAHLSALAASSHKVGTDGSPSRPRTPGTGVRNIDSKFQCTSYAPADQGWSALPAEKENRLITEKENPPDEQSLSSEGFLN